MDAALGFDNAMVLLKTISDFDHVVRPSCCEFVQAVKKAGVPVILDVGGMDTPIPNELLDAIDILSPNETELSRLTGMPTETFEQISEAVANCHKLVCFALAH